ncbi:unnamed protein product [Cyprideis torosa]|uniref:protein-ribulosamine 3-kinase n=1 Tax=Cyprideis torosa TaxID=163714 RepID=A0A7R8W7P2_9CRUS|nr:unnamed protein product [Cyprideis torosa]CAG0883444.1 unnamed protein product [Cyprideis torosa]
MAPSQSILDEACKILCVKSLRPAGSSGGGCINDGQSYYLDDSNKKIFLKTNRKSGARRMFEGEMASLRALEKTQSVRVPAPIAVIDDGGSKGAAMIMEHIDIHPLGSYESVLGEQMAKLHLHNGALLRHEEMRKGHVTGKRRRFRQASASTSSDDEEEEGATGGEEVRGVTQFGFDVTTCCGYLPLENEWARSWELFYASHRLKPQIDQLDAEYGDRELRELWSHMDRAIPLLFKGIEVTPALLHGDLWGGNVGSTGQVPVIFDPASFYGHSEFDFGIATIFSGELGNKFYSAYNSLVPQAKGWKERLKLYQLFHYLNHWNHFGGSYRGSSIRLMKEITGVRQTGR